MEGATCTKCGRFLAFELFGKSKNRPNGLHSHCKECTRKRVAEYRAKNLDRVRETSRKSVEKNRDLINARKRARRAADPEKTKAERAESYAKYREKELASMRKWKAENKERMVAYQRDKYWADVDASRRKQVEYLKARPGLNSARTMKRVAQKLRATPAWANHGAIAEIYAKAAQMRDEHGEAFEVDHIVPLQSKLVCGLHCEANLQVITQHQNRTKCNRYWPDMP